MALVAAKAVHFRLQCNYPQPSRGMPSQTFALSGEGTKPFGLSVAPTNLIVSVTALGHELSVVSGTVPKRLMKAGWVGFALATGVTPAVGVGWWRFIDFEYQYFAGLVTGANWDQLVYHCANGCQMSATVFY